VSRRIGTSYCWGVLSGPRLRQVALAARDCGRVAGELRRAFGWPPPFHDPGVGQFGLTNAVFTVGDTFVEVVAPAQRDTTAGRYLTRRGGNTGYMAIFQVPDLAAARRRVASLGVRVIWVADLPDIAATHLHPGDVPGAIVSLDWAAPERSWRWAGPSWTRRVPEHAPGGVTGLTIEVNDPAAAARRWAAVLGISGLSLALACDLRYAVPGAVLTTAFARVAFAGDYGGTWFLTRLVGSAKAKELYYFSERLSAEDAERLGIVNAIFPPADFEREVMERARRLAQGPSVAYRYMKENLNRAVSGELGDCMDLEVTHHVHTGLTQDHHEAAQAFVDKREPHFHGR